MAEEVLNLNPDARNHFLIARAFGPADNPTAAFADSLAAGAYAAHAHIPLLLTTSDSLHPAVTSFVANHQPATVSLLGGTAALSTTVHTSLSHHADEVHRIGGESRDHTAIEVDRQLWSGRSGPARILAEAYDPQAFTWSLPLAAYGGSTASPMLYTHPNGPSQHTRTWLAGLDNATVTMSGPHGPTDARDLVEHVDTILSSQPDPTTEPDPEPEQPSGKAQVRVATINYDPDGDDMAHGAGEYIELTSTAGLEIGGWTITDRAGNAITIPDGYTITANSTLRVHTGPGTSTTSRYFAGRGQAMWNNSGGDTATITDPTGRVITTYTYES